MRGFFHIVFIVLLALIPQMGAAQILAPSKDEVLDVDSVRRAFDDNRSYFGLYKDNYFIFGPSIGPKPRRVRIPMPCFRFLFRSVLQGACCRFIHIFTCFIRRNAFGMCLRNHSR